MFFFVIAIALLIFILCRIRFTHRDAYGFLHPNCDSGGGGERVLWLAVASLLKEKKRVIIFSRPRVNLQSLNKELRLKFNIKIDLDSVEFVEISQFSILLSSPQLYPLGTVFLQALGGVFLTFECLAKRPNLEYLIDTTGFALSYVTARFLMGNTKIVAYVHYPIMSFDMIDRVEKRLSSVTNREAIASSSLATFLKSFYYRCFLGVYRVSGYCLDFALCNSLWTKQRMDRVFNKNVRLELVHPPVDVASFRPLKNIKRSRRVVSCAQFRPEKNYELQLRVFARLNQSMKDKKLAPYEFHIFGSTRDEADEQYRISLENLAKKLNISEYLHFHVNCQFSTLVTGFQTASIGIHSMVDEHFGISVVEMLSAGLLVLCHNSGGPREDIIGPNEDMGLLARDENEFEDKLIRMAEGIETSASWVRELKARALYKLTKFNDNENFGAKFSKLLT